jgi:hypothetical protein
MGRTGCGMDKLGGEYSAEQRKAKGVARAEQDKLNRVACFARTAAGSALGRSARLPVQWRWDALPQV